MQRCLLFGLGFHFEQADQAVKIGFYACICQGLLLIVSSQSLLACSCVLNHAGGIQPGFQSLAVHFLGAAGGFYRMSDFKR
jgi:hypothetical protein